MSDGDMKSFKISDTRPPMVSKANKKEDNAQEQETFSVGYEKIEKLLEQEDPNDVLQGFQASLGQLLEIKQTSKSAREQAAVEKAIAAYELTIDLLEFLFQTKHYMVEEKE